jgi:hypothetical protein
VLADGSRQLRQLTLVRMAHLLPESTLVALMVRLPQLRLLRLLGCSAALSQERCQALVGQLQLYELQVDVVVDDGSGRARWMMRGLAEKWREARSVMSFLLVLALRTGAQAGTRAVCVGRV